jgi:hypothetical protein
VSKVQKTKKMTEVWTRFPGSDTGELACWDTYDQALRYLCSLIVPLLERRVLELENAGVYMDKELFFNKHGHVRKRIMKSEDDLQILTKLLWLDDEEETRLEWALKTVK